MDYKNWKIEYEKFNDLIKSKIDFIKDREAKIDLSKPDNYNRDIIKRINQERDFINLLLAFLIQTENLIKDLDASTKHLRAQNTVYFTRHEQMEAQLKDMETEYSKMYEFGIKNGFISPTTQI